MTVRVVATMHVQADKSEDFAALFNKEAERVRTEAGCEQYELFRSTTGGTFVVIERWKDRAALDAHLAIIRSGPPKPYSSLYQGRPTVEIYESAGQ